MPIVRINIPSKAKLPDLWDEVAPLFPMKEPRAMQGEALSVIKWALDNDSFDNIIVQAPTGIGKSAIAMTVQGMHGSAYLLTPSLGLTDQYRQDYAAKLREVRGRSNFPCWVRDGSAEGAPCFVKKTQCPHSKSDSPDPCPYYAQKFSAINHRLVLSNPAYMFRASLHQSGDNSFNQRELLIFDEAHEIESFFMGMLEVKIDVEDWRLCYGGMLPMPHHYHASAWADEIDAMMNACVKAIDALDYEDERDAKEIEDFENLKSRLKTLQLLLKDSSNVVNEVKADLVIFKPVRVSDFVPDNLARLGRKRLLLSATILDIETYLKSLGLENQKNLYVNITKSPFPKANTRIHYAPCGPMSFGKRKHTIPKQVKAIAAIMRNFPEQRGVVLPHSHAIRQDIVDGLKAAGFADRILTHGSDANERQAALDTFMTDFSKPYVLISTYVNQGFDFHGRLAEWLVLVKIPYLYTPDPQIAQRMETDEHLWREKHEGSPDCPYEPPSNYSGKLCGSWTCAKPCQSWFNLQTALKLVQMAGRIVRTPDDVGHIFILDRGFDRFQKQNGHLLPSWFSESIQPAPNWLKRHLP